MRPFSKRLPYEDYDTLNFKTITKFARECYVTVWWLLIEDALKIGAAAPVIYFWCTKTLLRGRFRFLCSYYKLIQCFHCNLPCYIQVRTWNRRIQRKKASTQGINSWSELDRNVINEKNVSRITAYQLHQLAHATCQPTRGARKRSLASINLLSQLIWPYLFTDRTESMSENFHSSVKMVNFQGTVWRLLKL